MVVRASEINFPEQLARSYAGAYMLERERLAEEIVDARVEDQRGAVYAIRAFARADVSPGNPPAQWMDWPGLRARARAVLLAQVVVALDSLNPPPLHLAAARTLLKALLHGRS